MALKLRLYRCTICGNIVQVLINGEGELICCGKEMELLEPKRVDIGSEKHVPVIETREDGSKIVKVGTEPHPMTNEHYIQFIEAISLDKQKLFIEFLKPEYKPEIHCTFDADSALEYCNIHGLWEGTND